MGKDARANIARENADAASAFRGSARYRLDTPPRPAWYRHIPVTLPVMLLGLAAVIACLVIPAREDARRARYELAAIERELDYVSRQVEINQAFLDRLPNDKELQSRLLLRLEPHRRDTGTTVDAAADLPTGIDASPLALTRLAPPAPLPPYQTDLHPRLRPLLDDSTRVTVMGVGLFLIAVGIVFGIGANSPKPAARDDDGD